MLFGSILALTAVIVSTEAAPFDPQQHAHYGARQLTLSDSPQAASGTSGWASWQQASSSRASLTSHPSASYTSYFHPSATTTETASQWATWHQSSSSQGLTYTSSSPSVNSYVSTTYVSSAPTSLTTLVSSRSILPTGPCGSVAVLAASSSAANPSATARVPAQLAFECLNSIPFNQSAAIEYLDSITPYITWQTTIEFLKDPPADYVEYIQPAYDFYATWDAIRANTSAGAYQSEYEFGWTVYRASQLAHDGHFVFYPDSVTSIFSFGRGLPLVSVSSDGVSEPRPYLYSDIMASSADNTSFTPSPIVQINGENAVDYLLVWSEYGSLQDPDALWNNLFYEPAQIALGSSGTGPGTFTGGGRGRWPYPGPSTTLVFANGTTLVHENYANVLQSFENVTSSADVYTQFLVPPPEAYQNVFEYAASTSSVALTSTSSSSSSTTPAPTPTPAPGYPTPFVQETSNLNAGYFIDAPGYEDVAVLVVRSFVSTTDDEIPFQAVNTYFIETAAALGKTKLIVDVSANGGGTILQGYDLFKQLFPSVLPFGATRLRAHEALDLLGEQSSYLAGLVPRSLDDNETYQDIESSVFNYRTDANLEYEPFTSWAEKYGPDAFGPGPDNFTSVIRWNLSDVLTPLNSGGIDVSGYLNRTNITTQYFAPENIIILTDGYCASTCTIFTELMIEQGVKTVALGGRPQPGITQAIGGVKGTNDFPFDYIFSSIAEVWGASNSSLQKAWEDTVLAEYNALALYRSVAVVVNARDGYTPNDLTLPLEFVYQPADCRILYTPAMVLDQSAVWKTVSDSVWYSSRGDACIAGNLNAGSQRRGVHGKAKTRSHKERRNIDYQAIRDSFKVETKNYPGKAGSSFMIP